MNWTGHASPAKSRMIVANSSGLSPWMLCPASSTTTTASWGRRRRNSATSSSSTTGERLPRASSTGTGIAWSASHRAWKSARSTCRPVSAGGRPTWWRQAHVPSGSWTELWRTPRRREDSDRVGLNWMVRSRISSKVANVSGPDRKAAMSDVLSLVDPRGDVDQQEPADQVGMAGGQDDRRGAAQRHADHRPGVGSEPLDDLGDVVGHGRRVEPGRVLGPVGVAVAGQVDGQQRPAERQGDRVPGVGVLPTAVHEHQLRRGLSPHQGADPPPGGHLDGLPPHHRRCGRRGGRPPRRSRGRGRTRRRSVRARSRSAPPVRVGSRGAGFGWSVGSGRARRRARRGCRRPPGTGCRTPPGRRARRSRSTTSAATSAGEPTAASVASMASSMRAGISSHRPDLLSALSSGCRSSQPSTSRTGR